MAETLRNRQPPGEDSHYHGNHSSHSNNNMVSQDTSRHGNNAANGRNSPTDNASILSNWFLLPLYVGNHIGQLIGPVEQDGFWGAVSTFILVLSAGMSMSLANYISEGSHPVTQPMQQLVLIGMMLVAIMVMLATVSHSDQLGDPHEDEDEEDEEGMDEEDEDYESGADSDSIPDEDFLQVEFIHNGPLNLIRKAIKDKLPIIGIGFFFVLGVYLDVTKILAHLNCIDILVFEYRDHLFSVIVDMVFHVFRMAYAAIAVVFTVQFEGIRFHRKWTVHYALFTIAAVTLNLWFETLLRDFVKAMKNEGNCTEDFDYHNNRNLSCYCEQTGLYKISETMAPYFYPLTIEFSLLVCEQLAHLLFHMQDVQTLQAEENQVPASPEPQTIRPTVDETTPLLPRSTNNSAFPQQQTSNWRGFVPFSVFLGIIVNALYLVTAIMLSINKKNKLYLDIDGVFNVLFYTLQCICIIVGFHLSSRFPSQNLYGESSHGQGGLHMLVVLSNTGQYIIGILSVVACLANIKLSDKDAPAPILILTLNILKVIMLYLQTAFMFHACAVKCPAAQTIEITRDNFESSLDTGADDAERLSTGADDIERFSTGDDDAERLSTDADDASDIAGGRDRRGDTLVMSSVTAEEQARFRRILLFMAICNGVMWIVESFISSRTYQETSPIQTGYYKETWSVIVHVCLPFILFMRFNSCFLFLGAYLDVGR